MRYTSGSGPIRLAIVDDHLHYRETLRYMLEQHSADIIIVGEAENGHDAIKLVRTARPDVVLMDLKMPQRGRRLSTKSCRYGVEAMREIMNIAPKTCILVLSNHDNDSHDLAFLFEVMRLNVSGYLAKRDELDNIDLLHAIRRVARGEPFYSPLVEQTFRNLASLSKQERRVFALLSRRASNDDIAEQLVIAEGTVKSHIGNILNKLDLRSREDMYPREDLLFFDVD